MEATHPPARSPRSQTLVQPSPQELERGAKQCVRLAREHCADWMWAFRNLPQGQYRAVCGLASLLVMAEAAVEERRGVPKTEAPCDQLREDLSDAFVGRYVSSPLYFISETASHYRIPKQFLFEPLEAFDRQWRFGQPANELELLATATRLGGALMRQLVHVLGCEHPGFEQAALKTGQGLTLTWWLLHLADDVRQDRLRLAQSDFAACQLKPEKVVWPEPSLELNQFVRLNAQRIDRLLAAGSSLYQHLTYDGQRVLKTLLGIGWKALSNVRLNPGLLRESRGGLSDADLFRLKTRQFLGLDAALPFGSGDEH